MEGIKDLLDHVKELLNNARKGENRMSIYEPLYWPT